MITEEPEIFYKLYPFEYWLSKANMLKRKIDDEETLSDDWDVADLGADPKRYAKMLRYELHFTYFQQIEALFELLFALQKLEDKYIWFNLSDSNGHENYDKIEKIAEGSLDLDEQEVKLTSGKKLTFLKWALYCRIPDNFSEPVVKKSIGQTKQLLKLAAKDFTDRESYNSYKHGMRVLPLLKNFSISDPKTKEKLASFDLSNSFSFLDIQKKKGFYKEITTTYNTKQDLFKIKVMTLIMGNIINSRKAKFYDLETVKLSTFADIDVVKKINAEHYPNRIERKIDFNQE